MLLAAAVLVRPEWGLWLWGEEREDGSRLSVTRCLEWMLPTPFSEKELVTSTSPHGQGYSDCLYRTKRSHKGQWPLARLASQEDLMMSPKGPSRWVCLRVGGSQGGSHHGQVWTELAEWPCFTVEAPPSVL